MALGPGNNLLKYSATLIIFYLAVSGLLTVLPRLQKTNRNFKDVVPGAVLFQPQVRENNDVFYYTALDKNKKPLGYAFIASGQGYSSSIVTMVGMDLQGNIIRIKILSQEETPDLGGRIVEPGFEEQFRGRKIEDLDRSVQAVSGATITSAAVIGAIKTKAAEILQHVHELAS